MAKSLIDRARRASGKVGSVLVLFVPFGVLLALRLLEIERARRRHRRWR